MDGKPKIREYWTVEFVDETRYYQLINDDNQIMAYGSMEEIERIARYLNEYEHVLKVYRKFQIEMDKLDG